MARQGKANQVRIIGGAYRRRMLSFPDQAGLRPTPDRVRETVFNWLGQTLLVSERFRLNDLYLATK